MDKPSWEFPPNYTEQDVTRFAGFLYLIRHKATGRLYVGKKNLRAKRRGKLVESNWRGYWSSCEPLLVQIKLEGHAAFERIIMAFYETTPELDYAEERELWIRDVLTATLPDGSPRYWNAHIGGCWFKTRMPGKRKAA